MIPSIIQPLRPLHIAANAWVQDDAIHPSLFRMGYPIHRWVHMTLDITVLSAVEVAKDKDGTTNGPEYHLSVSKATWPNGRYTASRIDTSGAKWVLAEFGLDGAEEDNHVPNGGVRNFWRPVSEPLVGKECRCKAEEVVIRENKGDFIWRP